MNWFEERTFENPGLRNRSLMLMIFIAAVFPVSACIAQTMQKGISVELPSTTYAAAMPDADNQDSLIVAVTEEGSLYFGIDPISPSALVEKLKGAQSSQTANRLYIKADARAPYASLIPVLDSVRAAGIKTVVLLTSEPESTGSGARIAPNGLEVFVGPPSTAESEPAIVQVLVSSERWPTLTINNGRIPWTALQGTLAKIFRNRTEKIALVKADGQLPFAQVVQVIDACRSTGAEVHLVKPQYEAGLRGLL